MLAAPLLVCAGGLVRAGVVWLVMVLGCYVLMLDLV